MAPPDPDERFLLELETLMAHEFFLSELISTRPNHQAGAFSVEQSYSYNPLHDQGYIRLLSLFPGSGDTPLKGVLLHVSLHAVQAYEALSYTWGPHEKPFQIMLSGGTLPITVSLHTALTHLRLPYERRLLWVDAVCIDQSNGAEKAQQVLLMPHIFSSASCVLAWLGDNEDNASNAFELLEQIGNTDFSTLSTMTITAEWMREHGLPAQGDRAWWEQMVFWQRPWFRRAWIVQEFVKAKDVIMIVCNIQIPWKRLISAFEKVAEYNLVDWGLFQESDAANDKNVAFAGVITMRLMQDIKSTSSMGKALAHNVRSFSERDESGLQEIRAGTWGGIPGVKEMVNVLREIPGLGQEATDLIEGIFDSVTSATGAPPLALDIPLIRLFPMFQFTEASEPRDRLFSLLGIAADGNDKSLYPDYSETTESVLMRYTETFIQKGYGIDVLYQAGLSDEYSILPSWVPDWTKPNAVKPKAISMGAQTGLLYKAASELPAQIRVSDKDGEIVVLGRFLDNIANILQFPSIETDNPNLVADICTFFEEADKMILGRDSYITGESLSEVQWRTLIGNQRTRPLIAPEEFGQQYPKFREIFERPDAITNFNYETGDEYARRFLQVSFGYGLSDMSGGLVGMVPTQAKVGDSIYLFNGCHMPFVLRKCLGYEDRYQIIGGCYVHGMMNGEALHTEKWKEEDIYIR